MNTKQAEAEVVPSSSLVEMEVEVQVEVGFEVEVEVGVGVEVEFGVEVEVEATFTGGWVGGWCGKVKTRANLSQLQLKLRLSLAIPFGLSHNFQNPFRFLNQHIQILGPPGGHF